MRRAGNLLQVTTCGQPGRRSLILLHGFMGDGTEWRDLMDGLSDGLQCIAVDLPGHGGSIGLADAKTYTVKGAAEAVCRVMAAHGVQRATILGYSMGGRLAFYLALKRPDLFDAVIIESGSPGLMFEHQRTARRAADDKLATRLESEPMADFLADWYRQPLFASLAARPELLRRLKERRLVNRGDELGRVLRGMGTGAQPSLWDSLPSLARPTLVIAGGEDAKYCAVAQRMADLSKSVQVAIVPDAGHNVHLEQPAAYERLVREFVTG